MFSVQSACVCFPLIQELLELEGTTLFKRYHELPQTQQPNLFKMPPSEEKVAMLKQKIKKTSFLIQSFLFTRDFQ